MKTAIYIEDGVTQLVLTPEDNFEKKVVAGIENTDSVVGIYKGGFYYCQGGWNRQSGGQESLMLRVTIKAEP